MKLHGPEDEHTLREASNLAATLNDLHRFKEAKLLLRKTVPVARRLIGESDILTLSMRAIYAEALFKGSDVTLDDLRKAVTALDDLARDSGRVLGGAHPFTGRMEDNLRATRAALRACEAPQGDA